MIAVKLQNSMRKNVSVTNRSYSKLGGLNGRDQPRSRQMETPKIILQ